MKDYEQIMKLMPKFAAFDTDGKRIFVDKMDDLCERIRISEMRAKLSNDPAVKGQLTTTNRQLLYMNTNMEAINAGGSDAWQAGTCAVMQYVWCQESAQLDHCVGGVVHAGMVDQCRQLRAIVEAETQISNPQELMEFRSMLAAAMSEESRMLETMAQALTPEKMTQHPEVMELLAKHPLAVKAIEDVVQGGAAAAEKYRDDPALHTALVLLFDL